MSFMQLEHFTEGYGSESYSLYMGIFYSVFVPNCIIIYGVVMVGTYELAVPLRHLSTGEGYTSPQYQWRVGRMTMCKFVPQVLKAILKEFQQEYLVCPTDPGNWKKIEERVRNR